MKSKVLFKITIVFVLLIGTLLSFSSSTSQAAKSSYLQNTKKVYVYRYNGNNSNLITVTYNGKSKDEDLKGYNAWTEIYEGENSGKGPYFEKETKNGLYNPDGLVISYPVKVGKKWKNDWAKLTIKSKKKTIKVPAGTFKNVVEVKVDSEGDTVYRYYAKGVGFILSVRDGKRTTELLTLKNK